MLCAPRHTTLWFATVVVVAVCGQACAAASATERAEALVRRHRDEAAVGVLQERLRRHPDDIPARRLLIALLGLTGDLRGARAEASELGRRSRANDPAPAVELGHALELAHRYDEALDAYDEAARVAPGSAEGPREGGMRCAHWGETELARPRLEEAVRRGARDGEVWHALGLVRLHLGDLDGAEEAYRAGAAARAPTDRTAEPGDRTVTSMVAENWLGLATVAVLRADAVASLAAYEQVLMRLPHFAPAELGRAWSLAKLGRASDASRALDHAAELGAPAANIARQRAALGLSLPQ